MPDDQDPIAIALTALRPRGVCAGLASLRSPFALVDDLQTVPIHFHMLIRGTAFVGDGSGVLQRISAGMAVVAINTPIVLMDNPCRHPIRLIDQVPNLTEWHMCIGKGSLETCLIYCGGIDLTPGALPLFLNGWDRYEVIGAGTSGHDPVLQQIQVAIAHAALHFRNGVSTVLSRLSEAWFTAWLRHHVEGKSGPDWITAASDPQIGKALQRMRCDPHLPWTAGGLAAEVGMSRTSFCQRFNHVVGEPPMAHLGRWRVQRGLTALGAGRSLVDAACDAGYADAPGFCRATKRITGHTPGQWLGMQDRK